MNNNNRHNTEEKSMAYWNGVERRNNPSRIDIETANQIKDIHKLLVGNGEVGFFERVRRMEWWVKGMRVFLIAILLELIISGRAVAVIKTIINLI